jgi:3-dehydroquinate synthase
MSTHVFQLPDYAVQVGPLEDCFPAWLRQRQHSALLLLCDDNTRQHCLPLFLQKTGLPADTPVACIPAGEAHKNIETCALLWQKMLEARLDRSALVINLGGGVIGDMGGFCAATWKRGVDFVQVPTTLLSMTDAAIGGKLGIDFQGVKNSVGVFQNPAAVFVDPDFLPTLPARELYSGFAEVVKHALIGDAELWENIRQHDRERLRHSDAATWAAMLRASIAVKVRVVAEDPFEQGIRALLNFGHTIGHALESWWLERDTPLAHGEAIAIGMVCEAHLAGGAAWLPQLEALCRRLYPPQPSPEAAFPALWALMQQDKKNKAGAVRMTTPAEGAFSMRVLEPAAAEVYQSLRYYNQGF